MAEPEIRTGLVPLLDDDGRLAAHHTPTVVEQRLATLEAAVAELTARTADRSGGALCPT